MDTTKQPGIRIVNILLAESEYRRIPEIPAGFTNHIEITTGVGLSEDGTRLMVELTGQLNTPDAPVYARVKYVGIFTQGEEPNMTLEEYGRIGAPATLMPYVRHEIHELTLKGGFGQVFVPPVNVTGAYVDLNKKG